MNSESNNEESYSSYEESDNSDENESYESNDTISSSSSFSNKESSESELSKDSIENESSSSFSSFSSSVSSSNEFSSSNNDNNSSIPIKRKTVGYYTNWSQYRFGNINGWLCKYTPDNVDPFAQDVIIFAFTVFDNSFKVKEYEWNDEQMIPKLIQLKKINPELKVMFAIGGWNFNYFESTKYLFSKMAENESTRKIFIKSCIDFIEKYNFDGIDIDWEYPANPELGGRPIDTQSFTLLIKELREELNKEMNKIGKKLYLTIAAPSGKTNFKNIEFKKIHQYLDWINIMAYDFHGSWDSITGSHTSFINDDFVNVVELIERFFNEEVPPNKMYLGLTNYGRGWTLKNENNNKMGSETIGASTEGICTRESGILSRYEIEDMIRKGGKDNYDENTMTMYVVKGNQFIAYDNINTLKIKADYVKKKGLGGVMWWSLDLEQDHKCVKEIKQYIEE